MRRQFKKSPKRHQLGVHLRSVRRTITTQELADAYGVSTRTIKTWFSTGKLVFTGNLFEDLKMLETLRQDPQHPST
jgi:DNA-binding transcriptional regulator YiaG